MPGTRPAYPAQADLIHCSGSGARILARSKGYVKLIDFEGGRLDGLALVYVGVGGVVEVIYTLNVY
jgi:hypothetical protein